MLLITGATGNIGRHVAPLLAARGTPARLLTRDPSRLAGTPSPLEVVRGSLGDREAVRRAAMGVDAMLLVSPPHPGIAEWEPIAIDAAKEAGVRHIVKVSVGGTAADAPVMLARVHHAAEEHLARSGVAATILRPVYFLQNLYASIPTIRGDGAIYDANGTAPMAVIDAADVAAVAVACLGDARHFGQTYTLTGPAAVTCDEIAAALSRASGRAIRHVSIPQEAYAEALIGAGLPEGLARDLALLSYFASQGYLATVTPDVERILGRPGHTLEEFAQAHGAAFA